MYTSISQRQCLDTNFAKSQAQLDQANPPQSRKMLNVTETLSKSSKIKLNLNLAA